MKRTVAILAGLSLAGGIATGQEQDAQTGSGAARTYGIESGTGLSQLSSEELRGRTVLTADGEEIGAIQEVGYSETHETRVATVDAGSFVGAGEKVIAIPLAELGMGSDDSVVTSMSRESIETQAEFDESDLTREK